MVVEEKLNIKQELINTLSAYLMGWKTLHDCAEWLSSLDWGILFNSPLADDIGELDLLITEISEGLRIESEFERKASELVANATCMIYSTTPSTFIIISSSDNTTKKIMFAASEYPVVPSLNISPQEAPV